MTALGSALGAVALLCALTVAVDRPRRRPLRQRPARPAGPAHRRDHHVRAALHPAADFVGQCSRIGAPGRDRRLASLRMAGATPGRRHQDRGRGVGHRRRGGRARGARRLPRRATAARRREWPGDAARPRPADRRPAAVVGAAGVVGGPAGSLRRCSARSPCGASRSPRSASCAHDAPRARRASCRRSCWSSARSAWRRSPRSSSCSTSQQRAFPLGALMFFALFMLAAGGLILGTASVAADDRAAARAARAPAVAADRQPPDDRAAAVGQPHELGDPARRADRRDRRGHARQRPAVDEPQPRVLREHVRPDRPRDRRRAGDRRRRAARQRRRGHRQPPAHATPRWRRAARRARCSRAPRSPRRCCR